MARARRRPKARQPAPTFEELKQLVRTEGVRYLNANNVNSVGIGRKISAAKGPTGEICIQFTVDRKIAAESLESVGSRLIPPSFEIHGKTVSTDVIERRFRSAWTLVPEGAMTKEERKTRQENLCPGLSVGHRAGTAGTIGAIVFDRSSGAPMLLSNWHVLQMLADDSAGVVGDEVVQPGPHDDNDVGPNVVGRVVRSHLGPAGDCAVASIEGRGFRVEILGLDTAIRRIGRAELDDVVVKSGRTTEVTYGVVTRIEVQSKIRYGSLEATVGGFEIGPDTKRKDSNLEISMGGDSGAAWLAADPKTGRATDVMLGLHFAGESSDAQPEFALACAAHSVFEKLGITLMPPARAGIRLVDGVASAERTFHGGGYDQNFLGFRLRRPEAATKAIRDDLVGADGDNVAHYTHFSLSMRKSRRLAAFVAWNIDGNITKPKSKDATWQTDSRIPANYQIDNSLYEGTAFDRGHIAKREDLLWGGATVAKRANDDSFCYTNATPQHEKFNRLAPALWKSLEDELFRQVDIADLRVALVGGPIFRSDDRLFKPSRAPAAFQPVRIPREFFKVVAYRDAADNRVKVLAFRLSQAELIGGQLETLAPEALDLGKFEMLQVGVSEIEKLTGLAMPDFRKLDVSAGPQAIAPEGLVRPEGRVIRTFSEILR